MATEVETLVLKIDDLISMLNEMNESIPSELEQQKNDLQLQVDIYELQSRLAILSK